MAEDPRARYGLSCPSGGSFYICGAADLRFVGCCDHDPCTGSANGECADGALHPASFSSTNYVDIPPQSCDAPYDGQNWWTCQNAKPPFLGCCRTNPCNEGCPDADLLPSRLSDNATNAEPFLETTAATTTSGAPDPAAATTTTGSPTGLIVGVTMGGIVVLLAGIGAFLWRKRQKEKQQAASTEEGVQNQPQTPGGGGGGDAPVIMGQQAQYSPYKVHSSPFPYQSSMGGGMTSPPPSSTASTCWSPRDARFSHHDRHTSQLSELSGDDYVHELPSEGSGLQTVPELDGGIRPGGGGAGVGGHQTQPIQSEGLLSPSGGGGGGLEGVAHIPRIAYIPSGSDINLGRQYHELDGRNR
ncbi:hypothetical protein SLS62_007517 [Diatrype stigma]|uniref:Uncharacterized protein n=1 Tax=Diatrype stigma TaxID=117547 RepID=A0AAN9UP37_9PEZI